MKYFVDNENKKVRLFEVCPTIDRNKLMGHGINGELHYVSKSELVDDGKDDDYVTVAIPLKFPVGFVPPAQFDEERCHWCPFRCDDDAGYFCHFEDSDGCPIKKYFTE